MERKLDSKTKIAKPQELRWKKLIKDKINSTSRDHSRLDRCSKKDLHKKTIRYSWKINIR